MEQLLLVIQSPHVQRVFSSLQALIMVMEPLQMQLHIFSRLQVLIMICVRPADTTPSAHSSPYTVPVLHMTIGFVPFALRTQKTWPLAVDIRHVASAGQHLRIAQYVEVQFKPE